MRMNRNNFHCTSMETKLELDDINRIRFRCIVYPIFIEFHKLIKYTTLKDKFRHYPNFFRHNKCNDISYSPSIFPRMFSKETSTMCRFSIFLAPITQRRLWLSKNFSLNCMETLYVPHILMYVMINVAKNFVVHISSMNKSNILIFSKINYYTISFLSLIFE